MNKGSYSQVGFSYNGDSNEDSQNVDGDDEDEDDEDEDDDDDEKDFSSDDSNDERMETIAKEFGVKRYNWLVYMDKKAKEEEKRQKEIIKGDPAIVSSFCCWCFGSIYFLLLHAVIYIPKFTEKIESQGKEESFSDGKGKRAGSSTFGWKGAAS